MDRNEVNDRLWSAEQAAQRLGVSRQTLYAWLAQSDAGTLVIRGQGVTIEYLQTGPRGQGRICIGHLEVERLRDLMRVRPQQLIPRRPPVPLQKFPGITVPLGRPADDAQLRG